MQTVVPKQLGIQNAQHREILRFTNGIANTGAGPLQIRPDPPQRTDQPEGTVTKAIQEILDADGNVVADHLASTFACAPRHAA